MKKYLKPIIIEERIEMEDIMLSSNDYRDFTEGGAADEGSEE